MRHRIRYSLFGALIGAGAPFGALLIRTWPDWTHESWSHEWARHDFFYYYMAVTALMFIAFGFFLGALTDRLRRKEREFMELSIRDDLTGIYNRRYFRMRLDEELHRATRYTSELNLIMFDLDFFKSTNDQYGHVAGDHILKALADLVHKRIRESDIFARYGGEEFILILPETPQSNAFRFIEALRQEIAGRTFSADGHSVTITISAGLCSVQENKDDLPTVNAVELLKATDFALYEAKNSGRNRTCIYKSPP